MLLIIEGPDGSGKTSLAEQLSKQTGYPIIHRSQPKSDEEKAVMFEEYLQLAKSGKNAILDRCWYSEMVYGPVMRDASVLSYPDMYQIESAAAKHGAIIIYCTDDVKVLWNRCKRRGEDYIVDADTFMKICRGYSVVMNVPHLIPVVRYGFKD